MRLLQEFTELIDRRSSLVSRALLQQISLDCAHAIRVLNPEGQVLSKIRDCRVSLEGFGQSALQEADSLTIPFKGQIRLDYLERIGITGGRWAQPLSGHCAWNHEDSNSYGAPKHVMTLAV
jgi:hypothetical protein